MVKLNMVYRRTQETPWNTIDNEAVVLNLDNGRYYVLNETGRRLWELLDGKRTLAQIASLMCAEYEVEEHRVQVDLVKVIEEMIEEGLVAPRDV